jgi:hypothetical protein
METVLELQELVPDMGDPDVQCFSTTSCLLASCDPPPTIIHCD